MACRRGISLTNTRTEESRRKLMMLYNQLSSEFCTSYTISNQFCLLSTSRQRTYVMSHTMFYTVCEMGMQLDSARKTTDKVNID